MLDILIVIGFSELIIGLGVILVDYSVQVYKRILPPKLYEEEIYKPIGLTEELFNDGFVEDMQNYDTRISDMKDYLNRKIEPIVETITDEQEAEREN